MSERYRESRLRAEEFINLTSSVKQLLRELDNREESLNDRWKFSRIKILVRTGALLVLPANPSLFQSVIQTFDRNIERMRETKLLLEQKLDERRTALQIELDKALLIQQRLGGLIKAPKE